MILGNIIGKTTTLNFKFLVKGNAKKFQYVQVPFKDNYVLAQIIEIEKELDRAVAFCNILGYREECKLKHLRYPLEPNTEVLVASEDFIKETLDLKEDKNSAFIGKLDGYENINIYLDLNKLLTKHVNILAKSGAGKSHTASVVIEEVIEKYIPLLIIDPHGEYSSLKYNNEKDKERLKQFGLESKNYKNKIQEYSPNIEDNPECMPLKLNKHNISTSELMHLLPAKLSNSQQALLYSVLNNINKIDFTQLILELELEENNLKYTLINILKYLEKLNLFSDAPTSLQELIQPGKCSIINLKGVLLELQQVIVYKLMKDLFEARKKANIPPFFAVIEEAHTFLPERIFGESKSSQILRQIASEGRKFGFGLCIISQRSSRLDKTVISQATTQIILKVTNPYDIKAIANSVENITSETEKEIKNIPIGTAIITGVVDLPLFVNIRPRKTKHGGEAVDMLQISKKVKAENFLEEAKSYDDKELLLVIKQKISVEDMELMGNKVKVNLVPCLYINCSEFNLLVNLNNGELIEDIEGGKGKSIFIKLELSPQQKRVFDVALSLKEFKAADLFAKSGVQFSEVYDIINILVNKNYFVKVNDKFRINPDLDLDFSKFSCYEKPDYFRLEYDKKLEKNYNSEEIKNFLEKFVKIKNSKECWLEVYTNER
ncbi:MAG: ATP-binding protein [Nanoarchaeota archaeon]|nr:ATP-binding protein [Nanoarchaeota archaeon]